MNVLRPSFSWPPPAASRTSRWALVGLILNATLGWSWADPIAALVIAAIAVKEGRDAWQGKGCCAPTATPAPASSHDDTDACGCQPGCACCP